MPSALVRLLLVGFFIIGQTGCILKTRIYSLNNPQGISETPSTSIMPSVELSLSSSTVSESVGQVIVTLTLSRAASSAVEVPFVITGTAVGAGIDYTFTSTTSILIPVGETSVTTNINVVDDVTVETDESIIFSMGTLTNAVAGAVSVQTLTITDNDVLGLTVASVYPANGSNWNDYIKYANVPNSDQYTQADVACDGTETSYLEQVDGCIHGGEKKKVVVTGVTSCANLTITDALGVFDWQCTISVGTATFFSIGLKPTKGLGDLVNATSWKNNSVNVLLSGNSVGTSVSSPWWTNPVVPLPANPSIADEPLVLDSVDDDGVGTGIDEAYLASTVFTLAATQATSGYIINADKYSVVTLGGSSLEFNGHMVYGCDYNTGEKSMGGNTTVMCVGGQKFVWIEGAYLGKGDLSTHNAVQVIQTNFSRVHNLTAAKAFYEPLWINLSNKNMFKNMKISQSKGYSIMWLDESKINSFYNVQLTENASVPNAGGSGLDINNNSNFNIFYNFNISNNTGHGLHVMGGHSNIFTKFIISSVQEKGVEAVGSSSNSSRMTYHHFTIANTDRTGMHFEGYSNLADDGTVNQVLITNQNTYGGIFLLSVHRFIVSQVLTAHSSDPGLNFSSTNDSKITNNILIGNTSGCSQGFGTNPGVTNACANQGLSDANIIVDDTAINLTNSFVGKVSSDSNTYDTAGLANYNTILDFLTFDNFFRGWGVDGGSAFPDVSQRGVCNGTTSCRIWDWRLRSTDTVARNKSNDGVNANALFIANSTCPAAVHGNKAITDQQTVPHTFLINAVEIVEDGIGNDNGLCENNEACIYSPNFGAYQGSGNYLTNGTCSFVNGTVTGVTMYAYPTNGE